jgi:hypothetical protein
VSGTSFTRLLGSLLEARPTAPDVQLLRHLAVVAAEVAGCAHVALALGRAGHAPALQAGSSPLAERAAEVEHTNGDGPTRSAVSAGRPVVTAQLGDRERSETATALAELGLHGAAAFPLQVGGAVLGSLTVYRDGEGALGSGQLAGLVELSSSLTELLLGLPWETDDGELVPPIDGADRVAVVHQATGMVAVQLGCDLTEALVRLRAYAFAAQQRLSEVATAVVTGTVRFGQ